MSNHRQVSQPTSESYHHRLQKVVGEGRAELLMRRVREMRDIKIYNHFNYNNYTVKLPITITKNYSNYMARVKICTIAA